MHIILETPRLILRRFTDSEADAALIFQLNNDPEVLKYLHEPLLESKEQARLILQNTILPQYENKLGRWAVHLKSNGFIGWCGLKYRPEINETDIGYRLMKSAWGKGYATEAANACLKYGVDYLHLSSIIGRAEIKNLASIAVLKKIGMHFLKVEMLDHSFVEKYEYRKPGYEIK
ncbi:MAG: GNAT family N-acetyltransferase [Gloeobacteraceae cyanobacterium ES-bin-316]|nr:GNAT family N-acetyltransferase [Ferruginibacter sp.]